MFEANVVYVNDKGLCAEVRCMGLVCQRPMIKACEQKAYV